MRRLRRRAIALVIVLVVLILAVLLGAAYYLNSRTIRIAGEDFEFREGVLRHFPNSTIDVNCKIPIGWSVSHSNEEGFRDDMLGKAQDFIGIFGDSFVEGYCVRDSERIDSQLERVLRASGRDYSVYNFGIGGYALSSSLRVLDLMSSRYEMRYAIVYFLPDDDMLGCDSSCQHVMEQEDPAGFLRFRENITTYSEDSHRNYQSLIRTGFEKLIYTQLVEKGILNRTRVVFYVFDTDPGSRDFIESVLDKYSIGHIYGEYPSVCQKPLVFCRVPLDGHPSGFFDSLIARQISDYLIFEEDYSAEKGRN
jgi:hypothetical protein